MPSYKVTIVCQGQEVVFEASSTVGESRQADYQGFDIVHLPTSILAYRATSSRHFSIAGKLVSRNPDEAQQNALYVDRIRSWVLPDFGNSGATPPFVQLYAFNNTNISGVKCVIKSYSFSYPDDVDYIFESQPPMPVIMSIDIQLEEVYSAKEITAKAWAIRKSPGGSFVRGSSNSVDFQSVGAFGGASSMLPNIAQVASNGFGGIANSSLLGSMQTVGGLMGASNPFNVSAGLGQTFGIASSPQISAGTLGGAMSNLPFVNGVNPAASLSGTLTSLAVDGLAIVGLNKLASSGAAAAIPGLQGLSQVMTVGVAADIFGRTAGLINKLPTFFNGQPAAPTDLKDTAYI